MSVMLDLCLSPHAASVLSQLITNARRGVVMFQLSGEDATTLDLIHNEIVKAFDMPRRMTPAEITGVIDDNSLPPGDIAAYKDWRKTQDESKATPRKLPSGRVVYPELGYRAWVELGRPASSDLPQLVGAPVEFRSADGKIEATAQVSSVEVHSRPYSIGSRRVPVDPVDHDDDTGERRCNNPDCAQCNPSLSELERLNLRAELRRRELSIEAPLPTLDIWRGLGLNSPLHLAELGMIRDRIAVDVEKLGEELGAKREIMDRRTATRERTAGMWLALRDLLSEKIDPMLEGWRKNEPQSRAAEIILNGEDPDLV